VTSAYVCRQGSEPVLKPGTLLPSSQEPVAAVEVAAGSRERTVLKPDCNLWKPSLVDVAVGNDETSIAVRLESGDRYHTQAA
jgi:hypothetical protein